VLLGRLTLTAGETVIVFCAQQGFSSSGGDATSGRLNESSIEAGFNGQRTFPEAAGQLTR